MWDHANFSVIGTLRDGRKIEIRAQRPEDGDGLRAAIARMSDESLYRRFFGPKHEFTQKEAAHFLDIDFVNHVALVALAEEKGEQAIIGACRYIVIDLGRAEAAFGVIDQYQGQGVGAALMRELAAIARSEGLRELTAEVLAGNSAMLKVFEKSSLQTSVIREGPVVHVTLRLR